MEMRYQSHLSNQLAFAFVVQAAIKSVFVSVPFKGHSI